MGFKLLKKETDVVNRDRMKMIENNSAKEKYFTDMYRLKDHYRYKNWIPKVMNIRGKTVVQGSRK